MPCLGTLLKAVASLALTTMIAVAVATPVAADWRRVHDGHGDVWYDPRPDGEPDMGNPEWGNANLRHVVYTHGPERVRVRYRMAEFDRSNGGYWEFEARFRTDEGVKAKVLGFWGGAGDLQMTWKGPGSCAVKGTLRWADDVIIIELPRTCLSSPNKVAFKAATRWWPTSDSAPYLDVAGTKGYRLRTWSKALARG